jgi:lipopolysaccharide/colanic/teichoic acid biosynthesis glycosyltransferase
MYTRALKRLFDILASGLGLIFLAPVFGLIALGIKRDSEGPIFYRGTRVGRHGKPFKMLKFRSMYERPESYNGSKLTANGDNRITPLGGWLRDTKLNELPQLWNILIGEMSFVGPRPEVADFVEKWPQDVREKILSMRPGMTSPASILYRDEEKQLNGDNFLDDYLKDIMPDKMRLDLLYVDNHSFISDLDVIFLTLLAILPRIRKVDIKERTLFSGPIYRFYFQHITWFIIDFFITFISVGIAGIVWRTEQVINLGFGRAILLAFSIAILLTVGGTLFGLHRIVWRYASPVLVIDVGLVVMLTSIVVVIVNHFWLDQIRLPLNFVFNFALLTFIGMIAARYRERLLTGVANRWTFARKDRKSLGERVLVVGAGDGGELAVWLLQRSEYASAFSVLGFVDDDYRKQNVQMLGMPVLGTTSDIPALVEKHDIGLILFSISKISPSERKRILNLCDQADVRVIVLPDLISKIKAPDDAPQSEIGM